MAMTQLQKLELNKRVDKILHAPSNLPARGQQLEMAFVLDLGGDREYLDNTIRDAVTALKAHDKIFQNVRSNVVYWAHDKITTKVTPMSFIQMGKTFVEVDVNMEDKDVDNDTDLNALCGYLKLYHARSKCILVFTDRNEDQFYAQKSDKLIENLNPFLKYRLLILTPEKMITGSELLLKLIQG